MVIWEAGLLSVLAMPAFNEKCWQSRTIPDQGKGLLLWEHACAFFLLFYDTVVHSGMQGAKIHY